MIVRNYRREYQHYRSVHNLVGLDITYYGCPARETRRGRRKALE